MAACIEPGMGPWQRPLPLIDKPSSLTYPASGRSRHTRKEIAHGIDLPSRENLMGQMEPGR